MPRSFPNAGAAAGLAMSAASGASDRGTRTGRSWRRAAWQGGSRAGSASLAANFSYAARWR
jgi:hypothetical protein